MAQTPRGLDGLQEVFDADIPRYRITEETRTSVKERGGLVRKSYDPTEYEARRQRILSQKLP